MRVGGRGFLNKMAGKTPGGRKGGGAEKELGARPKERRGRVVPSRYLDYERKAEGKSASASDLQVSKASFSKRVPVQAPKERPPEVLQSTVLDNHGSVHPDFEMSAIKDQTVATKAKKRSSAKKKREEAKLLTEVLDSQALLLTCAAVQVERKLALLEQEGERKLGRLLRERDRLRGEALRKRGLLAKREKQSQLSSALDAQLEALGPIEERSGRFQESYSALAVALDATRHALPLREVYVPEDQGQYLADLEAALSGSKELLAEALKEPGRSNADVRRPAQELQEAAQEVAQELPRAFSEVVELSAAVSKEVSLAAQAAGEESVGLELMEQLYFG